MKQQPTERRQAAHSFWLVLAIISLMFIFSTAAEAATFHVTTTADNGDNVNPTPGSLRKAIVDANSNAGADLIDFQIMPAGVVQTISPPAPLPSITDSVTIDGYTQPGANANTLADGENAVLLIELDGTNAGSGFSGIGLNVVKGSVTLRGLVINRFSNQGVAFFGLYNGSSGNTIEGCFIGTDPTATIARPNLNTGIYANDSSHNTIGGTAPAARNVISANGDSQGNGQGILLAGSTNDPIVGTLIQGNYIGTNAAGTAALGVQGTGVDLSSTSQTTIGGTVAGARNVISGNRRGIDTSETTQALIQGNYIGTDVTGTVKIGNKYACIRLDASNSTIGGSAPGARNIISGSEQDNGIGLQGDTCTGNVIQGNYIGTDVTGNQAIPNATGIGTPYTGNPSNNKIGGTGAGEGNLISGNRFNGISLTQNSANNVVQGNLIGTNAAGTGAIPNGDPVSKSGRGIVITATTAANLIGGTVPAARNVISGNFGYGIYVYAGAQNQLVQGNFIGVDVNGAALGNTNSGVYISAQNIQIGGTTAGAGNVIAFNGNGGVGVTSSDSVGNAINGNLIYSNVGLYANGGLGIDLGYNGVTKNDAGDGDSGPNNLQNFPLLNSASTSGGNTTIVGTLNSTANTQFRVEFFANAAPDALGYGEGQFFIGATNVNTDAAGNASINATFPGVPAGQFISTTATDSGGNTSEFSACIQLNAQPNSAVLQFSSATFSGNEGGSATITVTRTGGSTGAVSVQYATSNGSAISGQDYTATSGTLNWADGDSANKTFTVAITNDQLNEPNETVNLALTNPAGGATLGNQSGAVLTIIDDDPAPSVSINDVSQAEGNSGTTSFNFSVTLSAASGQTVSVDYSTAAGTATIGNDFQPANGTLTFAAGETQQSVNILVNGDADDEPDETFFVQLGNPTNATLAKAQGTGTIINDDSGGAPSIQFSADSYSVQEDLTAAAITVTRSGDTSGTASVDYATADGTAHQKGDYETAFGTLKFAPGEVSKTFPVLINEDNYAEGTETVNLTLSNPAGAALGAQNTAVLNIKDDEVESVTNPNDDAQNFVYQQYHDFLNREPDSGGLAYWTDQLKQCGSDQSCISKTRIAVSNAFFYELEYQQTGSYVFRLYRAAYGDNQPFPNPDNLNPTEANKVPSYAVYVRDRATVAGGSNLAQSQLELANAFVQRPEFLQRYPESLNTAQSFISALLQNILAADGVDLSDQMSALTSLYNAGGRGAVLYRLADDNPANPVANNGFLNAEYNRTFVATQYFGYLRRNADMGGLLFWLGQVNSAPLKDITKQHAMVCSFITSAEYQDRFSAIHTHGNGECGQ